jgi:hypothetical protein
VLAFAQPGEQHGLPVGELQRIVVHPRVTSMLICRNRATFLPSFIFGKRLKVRSYLTSFSNATSVPGKRHTATFGAPIAASPRVMEFLNFVVTNSSPTFAGREATRSRL